MLEILGVQSGSIAQELGITAGDRLVAVNGQPVRDLLDYLLEDKKETVQLEVDHAGDEVWEFEIEKDAEEPLGLLLPHPEPMQCGNNCIFCFVHQLPRGMRRTLYIKDEDYRFSYLYGAYITLSNLDDAAIERITTQNLSPLYVSVHATDETVREELLGRRCRSVLEQLQRLVTAGIEVHTQVVVCPGVNDGDTLQKTFDDLVALGDNIRSLAIVPVGLTGHREKLPDLRPLSQDEAKALLTWVDASQKVALQRFGRRFVYAADELYLKADTDFPALDEYEDLPQIENGVGLVAVFRHQAEDVLKHASSLDLPPMSVVTGRSAEGELLQFIQTLSERTGLTIHVHAVDNRFFGHQVTVTGLLTGRDLLEQLSGKDLGDILLVPEVVLRDGEEVFLDDMTIDELEKALEVRVMFVISDPWGLWDALEELAAET